MYAATNPLLNDIDVFAHPNKTLFVFVDPFDHRESNFSLRQVPVTEQGQCKGESKSDVQDGLACYDDGQFLRLGAF